MVHLVLVVGLYLFTGLSGVVSFGHAGFAAVGAYVGALLVLPGPRKALLLPDLPATVATAQLPPGLAVLAGGVAAALVAAVLALPLMRLSGLAAGLATVSLLIVVRVVAQYWEAVTNGTAGVAGLPRETDPWTVGAWAVVAIVIAHGYRRSRRGLLLVASRDDEVSARSVGVRVVGERVLAFVLSAFVTGIGGALLGQVLGVVSPDQFFVTLTFLVIAMLVIGGMSSLTGAVAGAVSVAVFMEVLRTVERGVVLGPLEVPARPGLSEVGLALLLVVLLVVAPRGITGGKEIAART